MYLNSASSLFLPCKRSLLFFVCYPCLTSFVFSNPGFCLFPLCLVSLILPLLFDSCFLLDQRTCLVLYLFCSSASLLPFTLGSSSISLYRSYCTSTRFRLYDSHMWFLLLQSNKCTGWLCVTLVSVVIIYLSFLTTVVCIYFSR